MSSVRPVRVIAVTSGKGGAGKTSVAVNLSVALGKLGQRVVLLDADLGMSSVDYSLGLKPEQTLVDVIEGRCNLRDILILAPSGIRVIPAAAGHQRMTSLTTAQHSGLIQAFSELDDDIDVLIIDTAAGIGDLVVNFVSAAQEVMVVVCNDPTSIGNAYSLMTTLNCDYGINRFHIVVNKINDQYEGASVMNRLVKMTENSIDATLQYAGAIPHDEFMVKALTNQKVLSEMFPASKASRAFQTLARKVDRGHIQSSPRGNIEFFVERLIQKKANL